MADFKVNGKEIDLPDMGTFSIDEAIVLYEYSGMTLDQAEEIEGLHPGIIGGLVHIAIARAEPERKAKEIEKAVRAMNLLDLLTSIPDEEEGEKEDLAPGSETSSSSSDVSSGAEFREEFGSVPGPRTSRRILGRPNRILLSCPGRSWSSDPGSAHGVRGRVQRHPRRERILMPTVVVHGLREIELLAKSKGREASRTLNKELRASRSRSGPTPSGWRPRTSPASARGGGRCESASHNVSSTSHRRNAASKDAATFHGAGQGSLT
jgi:hypothetical protein